MYGLLVPKRPLWDKFLHGALVPTYTYKYQFSSSISLGVMN